MTPHPISKTGSVFPLLILWSNLGALNGMAALACGIFLADKTPLRMLLLQEQLYPVFLPAAIAAFGSGILAQNKSLRFAAFLTAGILLYCMRTIQTERIVNSIAALPQSDIEISGDVVSWPEPRSKGFVFLFSVREIDGKKNPILSGKLFLCDCMQRPGDNGSLVVYGAVRCADSPNNRYEFNERTFFASNGIAGKIDVKRILEEKPPSTSGKRLALRFRLKLMNVLRRYMKTEHRALMRASFTGEKAYLAPEIKDAFRRSGLYHLLALSGFHAAILLTALYFLLAAFPIPVCLKHVAAISALWVYLGFIGPIPSLTRAVVMASVVIVTIIFQRKNYPLQSWGIAGIIWLAFSPMSLFQPSFQLSYAAAFGILTLHPLMAQIYRGASNAIVDFFLRPVLQSLSVSISAFLMTLPILLYFFGYVSIYGIVANIAAIPLMSGAMWSFFTALIASFFSSSISDAAIALSADFLDCLLMIASLAEKLPFVLIRSYAPPPETIAAFYLLLLAATTVDKRRRKQVIALGIPILLCFIPGDYLLRRVTTPPRIVRFDTGANTAITAVRWPEGGSWIFCSGELYAVRNELRHQVSEWRRHTAGTTIDRLLIYGSADQLVDSGGQGGRKILDNVDSFKIIHSASRCTCCFFGGAGRRTLLVKCKNARLVSDHTRPAVSVSNDGESACITVNAPVEAALCGKRFRIRNFR